MLRRWQARQRQALLPLVLLLTYAATGTEGQGLPPSPCPSVYSYEVDLSGITVGLIRLFTPPRYDQVRLVVRMASSVPVNRNEVGELVIRGGRDAAMEATRAVLANRRHLLQYNVRFPPGKPVPALMGLNVNGYDVCANQAPPANSRSTITLQSFLNTGVSDAPRVDGRQFQPAGEAGGGGGGGGPPPTPVRPQRPRPEFPAPITESPQPPVIDPGPFHPEPWPQTITTTRRPQPPPRPVPTLDTVSEEEDEPLLDPTTCGTAQQHNALVVFGSEAKKGQWPWQTAIFRNNDSESSSVTLHFQCGGTLVSRRHVITAAHCVVMAKERKRIQLIANSDLLISLGKYNIRNWAESDQQLKEVKKIMPHPDYNAEILRNDLAIIELSTTIIISEYVRPICLWDRTPDLSPLVGEVGTVGGWGRDESGSLSDKLRIASMPIVSQETCLRSDNSFYLKYTSENTFCAGFRNGTTVCNGDSGGGLHLKLQNAHQSDSRTWYLRGVVSLSMLEVGEQTCDTRNFVVFTDVAKYMTWVVKMLN